MSRVYRRLQQDELTRKYEVAPAYHTRIRDGIQTISKEDFKTVFYFIKNPLLSSKTKENAFIVVNRTLWTNNKAFKSGLANENTCPYCNEIETMEHLLANCDAYSYSRWENLGRTIKQTLRTLLDNAIFQFDITYNSIFFHKEAEFSNVKLVPTPVRQTIQLLIHETRRDIYLKRQQDPEGQRNVNPQFRIMAHIASTTKKVMQFLKYLSAIRWSQALSFLDMLHTNAFSI